MAVQYCPRAIYSVKTVIRTFNAVDGRPLAAAGLLAICLFMLATESKNKKKSKWDQNLHFVHCMQYQ